MICNGDTFTVLIDGEPVKPGVGRHWEVAWGRSLRDGTDESYLRVDGCPIYAPWQVVLDRTGELIASGGEERVPLRFSRGA